MRDAKGGEAVRARVREAFGVDARVISGDEEARVSFLGATSGLGLRTGEISVFDVGGGSTEVIVGAPPDDVRWARSFDVGSVRLTERHVKSDPPTLPQIQAVLADARAAFAPIPGVGGVPIGVAGTMTTLAAIALDMDPYDGARVHGTRLTANELRRLVDRLAAKPLQERRLTRGLEPKRADVIVAGGLIAVALLDHWQATDVRISDRGVRYGIAAQLLAN
jgi:exopolyphosphatase/guanosine-5'-triphosphate,3'-diphosphate pyrophosphatase